MNVPDDPMSPCCLMMRFNLGNSTIRYRKAPGEYSIPYGPDSGASVIVIRFCPWCGTPLPPNQEEQLRAAANEQHLALYAVEDLMTEYFLRGLDFPELRRRMGELLSTRTDWPATLALAVVRMLEVDPARHADVLKATGGVSDAVDREIHGDEPVCEEEN